MIKVAVSGCFGRMGSAVIDAVSAADDMEVACGIDPLAPRRGQHSRSTPRWRRPWLPAGVDVVVDFTQPSVIEGNLRCALPAGIDCVVGTTGLSDEKLDRTRRACAFRDMLVLRSELHDGRGAHDGVRQGSSPLLPRGGSHRDAPLQQEGRAFRAPPCARRRSLRMREAAERARHPGPRRSFRGLKVRAVRSSRVFRCTPCARWASSRARRSSSDRWDRRSPSATTPGIERPTCPAFYWVSEASGAREGLIVGLENFMHEA